MVGFDTRLKMSRWISLWKKWFITYLAVCLCGFPAAYIYQLAMAGHYWTIAALAAIPVVLLVLVVLLLPWYLKLSKVRSATDMSTNKALASNPITERDLREWKRKHKYFKDMHKKMKEKADKDKHNRN
jgi:uncharacterized membrane protein